MYSLGTRLSVYTANRGEISLENRNKISICAPTRLLKRLRQCNAERRGVKFDSTERRQKGGEGSLVPNVTRSQNQPSSVSYTYIYIYAGNPPPRFLDDRDTSPPHDSFTRTIARFLRTKKKKKKLPSTCPKLLRQQLSCDAWRGVKGHGDGRFSLRYRDCENGTDRSPTRGNHHHHHHHQLSRSTTTTLLLSTRSFIFRSTLFSIYYSGGERGRSKRSCPLSLSLISLSERISRPPCLPFFSSFQRSDLKGCSSGRKAR